MDTPKSNHKTKISNTQGVVVGEHNKIYQYFQTPEHTAIASKHIGFQPLIADKTKEFVGRDFVFEALDMFLQENNSGYFLILGEPGIGKTAVVSQLIKARGYPHHFNIAPQNIRSPRQFLANACAQLIARYDLPHKIIPEGATEDSNFLLQCLEESAVNPKNHPVVLVVDALDESERDNLPARVNALYLPPTLPDGTYIVLTSRPLDDLRLEISNQKRLFLEPESDGNMLDIRAYIETFVENTDGIQKEIKTWGISTTDFIEDLAKKSEGNFIYLRYMLPDIAEGKFKNMEFKKLPVGLAAYYRGHWNSMQIAEPEAFDDLYAPIVCMLAVVREPVTIDQLNNWTGKERLHIRRAIAQWREFLEVSHSETDEKYRVYHTSFQDFLGKTVDLKQFDEMITRYYLGVLGME